MTEKEAEEFFSRVKHDYETYGAVEEDGDVVFGKVNEFSQISDRRSRYAPKEFIMARNEDVLKFSSTEKRAVFGVKSCDLKGFYIMDKQILGKDPFYTDKRENTLFVNFICDAKCEGGFCTSFGGPVLEEFQIQVLKDGEWYYAITSPEYRQYFDGFSETDDSVIEKFSKRFSEGGTVLKVDGIENRIKWNSRLWSKFASECISCGACNYSCPTCYCFDLYDNGEARLREWDSCILAGFTSTSAGNIRSHLDERLRQRFYHKFVYYKKAREEYLCTGCDRCVEDCPVDIDIKEVVTNDYENE